MYGPIKISIFLTICVFEYWSEDFFCFSNFCGVQHLLSFHQLHIQLWVATLHEQI